LPSLVIKIKFKNINKKNPLHVYDFFEHFVAYIFDINPLQFKLLVEFVGLPPKWEFFVLIA